MPVEARLCRQSGVRSHFGGTGRAQNAPVRRQSFSGGGQGRSPHGTLRRLAENYAPAPKRPDLEQTRSTPASIRCGVPCKRIALPQASPRTVPGVFLTGPPSARARTGSSADLPPPRSSPAGSRDFIVSAPLSHFWLSYHLPNPVARGKAQKVLVETDENAAAPCREAPERAILWFAE